MFKPKIAIIDYGMGNLFSIYNACLLLNTDPEITSDPDMIKAADAIIFPGVGAFPIAMHNLRELNLVHVIKDVIKCGKPFLGICLGFQLLFSNSKEFNDCEGLNVFSGQVFSLKGIRKRVPHIGWEKIFCNKKSFSPYLDNKDFYFVHSFYVEPNNKDIINSYFLEGEKKVCASIIYENVFATQFHPEKSGKQGIKLLKCFLNNMR